MSLEDELTVYECKHTELMGQPPEQAPTSWICVGCKLVFTPGERVILKEIRKLARRLADT